MRILTCTILVITIDDPLKPFVNRRSHDVFMRVRSFLDKKREVVVLLTSTWVASTHGLTKWKL